MLWMLASFSPIFLQKAGKSGPFSQSAFVSSYAAGRVVSTGSVSAGASAANFSG
jgi:hypothetical protein